MVKIVPVRVRRNLRRGTRRPGRTPMRKVYRGQQGWRWVSVVDDFTFTGAANDVGVYCTLVDGSDFQDSDGIKEAKAVMLDRLIGQVRLRYLPGLEVFPFANVDVWIAKVPDEGIWEVTTNQLVGTDFANLQAYDVGHTEFHLLQWFPMWAANLGGFARFSPAADPTEVMLPAVGPFPPVAGEIIAASDVYGRSMRDFDFSRAKWGMGDHEKLVFGVSLAPNELLTSGASISYELTCRQVVVKHR